MKGGFRPLVNPGCLVSTVDIEGTQAKRQRLHEEVRLRAHLVELLESLRPDDPRLRVVNEDQSSAMAKPGPEAA